MVVETATPHRSGHASATWGSLKPDRTEADMPSSAGRNRSAQGGRPGLRAVGNTSGADDFLSRLHAVRAANPATRVDVDGLVPADVDGSSSAVGGGPWDNWNNWDNTRYPGE
jgi:hypothetical protein